VADPQREVVPRNATELFNRGSPEWTTMFWDGRVNISDIYGLRTPVGNGLPPLLQTALQAQAMFPVTSREEMRGFFATTTPTGNERNRRRQRHAQADLGATINGCWPCPASRRTVPRRLPDVRGQLGFEHAANALAAYEVAAFTSPTAPGIATWR
jgi:cytochrome c peroxidase